MENICGVTYRDEGLTPAWPGAIWSMGSTFERGVTNTAVTAEGHERNARSLETIAPAAAQHLRSELSQGTIGIYTTPQAFDRAEWGL